MIKRPALALVLSSALLASCGAGGEPELSTETDVSAQTTKTLAESAGDASTTAGNAPDGPDASETSESDVGRTESTVPSASTEPTPAAHGGAADGSATGDPGGEAEDAEGAMSAEEMAELERTLDEIDDLLADLELELEAD